MIFHLGLSWNLLGTKRISCLHHSPVSVRGQGHAFSRPIFRICPSKSHLAKSIRHYPSLCAGNEKEITSGISTQSRQLIETILQELFPLDYILYSWIIIFFVMCSISGLKNLGIRFLWLTVYKIKPYSTKPQALVTTNNPFI